MNKKKKIAIGAGGGGALLALAAAGFALAPENRGPARADLNGDGQVSAAEIAQSGKQRFAELDADGDGKLSGAEMPRRGGREKRGGHGRGARGGEGGPQLYQVVQPAPVAAQPGAAPQPQAVPQQVLLAPVRAERPSPDADGDGALTLAEFLAGHRQRLTRADANRDGELSAEELAARPQGRRRR
ncbi:MAG TPA: hypothetical protein VGC35_04935 [Allosphingosinicella sp.]|jgi:hypothetical protein